MASKPRIFVSYSSADHAKADAIRAAIEAAGVPCWIAPRDLTAGAQWGGGIVQAIEACEAVLVVFSQAANDSPQVAREMELAVSRRRPLIPVRVADVMPTDDMQYFLGVSHWFNAYAQPIETYLPDIIVAVKRVLSRERRPWTDLQQRMPKTRAGQVALSIGVAAVVAVIIGFLMQPHLPTGMPPSPLAGRWRTTMPNGQGGTTTCTLDVQKTGMASFSDDCPDTFSGASGTLTTAKDGTWAQNLFKQGDSGSFILEGGLANFEAAFKIGLFGGLTTRDARFGDLNWSRISSSGPLNPDAPTIIPAGAAWPLSNTVTVVRNATAYVRKHWQADAVLMMLDLKPDPQTGIYAAFTYYSPSQQQVTIYLPTVQGGQMMAPTGAQDDPSQAVPAQFLDLPQAIARARQAGIQGKQISEAQLYWSEGGSCGGGDFAANNAILPGCPRTRFVGVQWQINTAIGEQFFVPATN